MVFKTEVAPMDEIKEEKQEISKDIVKKLGAFSTDEVVQKSRQIEKRLFEFANFVEAHVVLLYLSKAGEVDTWQIISSCFAHGKVVVVPLFDGKGKNFKLLKVSDVNKDIINTAGQGLVPDPSRCRVVPVNGIEIALIPGLVFDEKGARIGLGNGHYDKLLPRLPATTRKVSLAFEDQIIQQIPKGSIDRYVDIIITEERIIYKI